MEKISIIGLGKLGLCLAACYAKRGFQVLGIDINKEVVDKVNLGKAPWHEPGLDEILKEHGGFTLKADTDGRRAIEETDISIILTATPSNPNGTFSNKYIKQILFTLSQALLKNNKPYHLFIISSTVMPGSIEEKFIPLIESFSGRVLNKGFGVGYVPDFVALGNVIKGFLEPEIVIIGQSVPEVGDRIERMYAGLCMNKPVISKMSLISAELAKVCLNAYITMKISFANVIANLCEKIPNADPDHVTQAIGADKRISPYYFKGGLAFGGTCVKPDTLIQTDNGLFPIDSLKIGDKVLTHKGRFRKITHIFQRNYSGLMIKITSMGYPFKPIETTPEHPVWSAQRIYFGNKYKIVSTTGKKRLKSFKGFRSPEFIPAYKLEPSDSILMPILKLDPIQIPVLNFKTHWLSQVPARLETTPELLKFFGFFVAEGSTWKKEITISLHKKEINYANEIACIIKKYFGAKSKFIYKSKNGMAVRCNVTHLAPYLRETFGHRAENKKIPWEWLALPNSYLVELLRGLWYGDGSRSNGIFCYGTVSFDLCRFIQLSLFKLGISCNVNKTKKRISKNGVHHQEAYFLRVANGDFYEKMNEILPELKISSIPKGSKLSRKNNSSYEYNIKSKQEKYYEGFVYNLEVEEDNSYVLEWGTVHNCFPRDAQMFHTLMNKHNLFPGLAAAIKDINFFQDFHLKEIVFNEVKKYDAPIVAILGLSFTANTPVIIESSAIKLISKLLEENIPVIVYDPHAMPNVRSQFDNSIIYAESEIDCITDANVIVITHRSDDFKKAVETVQFKKSVTIIDCWRIIDSEQLKGPVYYIPVGKHT